MEGTPFVDHMHHFTYGPLTPVLAYVMACTGAAIGLRCTTRALSTSGPGRRSWLLAAAGAIGAGIWTMHFIAMLGFTVDGSQIRYDVPLTLLSLVVAMVVVGIGLFTVGYSSPSPRPLVLGGVVMGLGVAAMHYTGMAAVTINGVFSYNSYLVTLSIMIAIFAATAALWIALKVHRLAAALGASLVMGVAVSSMHYTGMAALSVTVNDSDVELSGATAHSFILPLAVGMTALLFMTLTIIALSPQEEVMVESRITQQLRELDRQAFGTGPSGSAPGNGRPGRRAAWGPRAEEEHSQRQRGAPGGPR